MCQCGCGERTNVARQTDRTKGWVKGEPLRFILGHALRTMSRPPLGPDDYTVTNMGHSTPCWIRRGFRTTKGYARVTIAGRNQYAHRAMYEQEIGPIPRGLTLDHLCRVRTCIRPSHLEPVATRTNLRRGNGAILTERDVVAIRDAPPSVTTKELAVLYGVSASQMSRVRRGLRWVRPD